jgi:hypothetical protein
MDRSIRPGLPLAAVASMFALLSCGGGDSRTPTDPDPDPSGQTVTVQVTTSGTDLDPDGYTVRLGSRSAGVQANGTATFTGVAAGSHELRLDGVALNCLPEGGPTRSITVGASAGAQAAFDVECFVDFEDGLATEVCPGLTTATPSGAPLDRVDLGPVPAGFEPPLAARILSVDRDFEGYTGIYVEGGRMLALVPIHPSGAAGGGAVYLRPTDGARACAPVNLNIDPVPAASGELDAIVDALQAMVAIQASVLGTSTDELRTTPIGDLAQVLLPLGAVQYVLDHPQNERSLRRVAAGEGSLVVPLELLEGVLRQAGVRGELEGMLAAANPSPVRGPLQSLGTQTCTPGAIGGSETRILSDCMNAQAEAAAALGSDQGADLQAANDAMWLFEALPDEASGAGIPVISAIAWALENSDARAAALLPCCLIDLSVDPDPQAFEEDNPRRGTWYAILTAVNQGWDVGREIIEAAIKSAGMAGPMSKLNVGGPESNNVLNAILTGPLADRLLADGTFDDFIVPVETFGPVPIFDEEWSDVTLEGPVFSRPTHNTYEAEEAGAATLVVRNRSDGRFGSQELSMDVPLRVDPIEIRVMPADTFVGPEDSKTFRVTILNSLFPDSIDIVVDQGAGELDGGSGAQRTVLYAPPPNARFENPDELMVFHTARSGARENGPLRSGTATIRFGKVQITPVPACLDLDAEYTFTAEFEGPENDELEWSADFGDIDQDGAYRAPSTRPASGYVTIRAESVEHPALADEVLVPIGCQCHFTLNVDGTRVTGQPGDRVTFTDWGGPDDPYGNNYELFSVTVARLSEGWSTTVFPLDEDPATWPGGVGTTEGVRIQGDMGLGQGDILYASVDTLPNFIEVQEYTPEVSVKGRAAAHTVQIISTTFPFTRPSPLAMTFAVTVPPGTQRGPPLPPWGYRFSCTIGEG